MNKKLLKLSLICFIIAVFVLAFAYFFFHYVTDTGITLIKQEEAGKPFVTDLIGQFGVLFLFSSVLSLIIAIIYKKENEAKN